jgi:hypothetical protein
MADFKVELPAGGPMHLQSADEVDLWAKALARYREDYVIVKLNDLVTLGILLQQQVIVFRCQMAINGMEPAVDSKGIPTGQYKRVELDGADLAAYQKALIEASKEMRAVEKQLGIDKAARESGGAHTLDNYIKFLKKAAHERGIHISKRTLEVERVFNEALWKLRILYGADAEDRAYHNITPRTVLDWLKEEAEKIVELDKTYAKEKGKLYFGQL